MAKTTLEKGLAQAEELYKNGEPHPYVIGYLIGTIKIAIQTLDL